MSTPSNGNEWFTIPKNTNWDTEFREKHCHFEKFKELYIDTSNSLKKTITGSNQSLSLDDMRDEEILSELAKEFPGTSIILEITDQSFICFDSLWGEWLITSNKRWVSYPPNTFTKLL